MYKIKRIKFHDHKVLNDLDIDFCDTNGNIADTVIIAGENGCGKSTLLDILYKITSGNVVAADYMCEMEILDCLCNEVILCQYEVYLNSSNLGVSYSNQNGKFMLGQANSPYKFSSIFSDVDINFNSKAIQNVTSLEIDDVATSRKSDENLATQITQLLIDVKAMDAQDLQEEYENAKMANTDLNVLIADRRMSRFNSAFSFMGNNLKVEKVINQNKKKVVLFNKNDKMIPLETLSSGEKQIIFRNSFLLKDVNSLSGAFVYIDEPEISLHPTWQMKIMENYKRIFTNELGEQTSQIFAVTHSPFIIHNENRRNDKVIVLKHDENGKIVVSDRPEYYLCNGQAAIEDAFEIKDFSHDKPCVYLEGRTDKMYFEKATEVFGYSDLPFDFKWIGYIDSKGEEANTGKDSLNKGFQFTIAKNADIKNVFLFDCDTKRGEERICDVYARTITYNANNEKMKKGSENCLNIDGICLDDFYRTKTSIGDYGEKKEIEEFQKMEFCKYICAKTNEELVSILANFNAEIQKLIVMFGDEE